MLTAALKNPSLHLLADGRNVPPWDPLVLREPSNQTKNQEIGLPPGRVCRNRDPRLLVEHFICVSGGVEGGGELLADQGPPWSFAE